MAPIKVFSLSAVYNVCDSYVGNISIVSDNENLVSHL